MMSSTTTAAILGATPPTSVPSTLATLPSSAKLHWQASLATDMFNDFLPTGESVLSPGTLVARQMPSSGSGSDSDGSGDGDDSPRMSTYYFVFFALLICIAVLCIYFVWRKRRNALTVRGNARVSGYQRDLREWDTPRYRRQYWNTNFRNAEVTREEGLNEHGDAPPPYMPKEDENIGSDGPQANGQLGHGQGGSSDPAIPLQTLSRDQAGLKPPGYEQIVQPVGSQPSGSRLP